MVVVMNCGVWVCEIGAACLKPGSPRGNVPIPWIWMALIVLLYIEFDHGIIVVIFLMLKAESLVWFMINRGAMVLALLRVKPVVWLKISCGAIMM